MIELDKKILTDSGLSDDQAKIYLFLLENGLNPVKVISAKTSVGRALCYKVLEQLIGLKLVEKRVIGKIAMFSPNHPSRLKEMLNEKVFSADHALLALDGAMGKLSSSYNSLHGKPNVQFYEGTEGLQKIYDDILEVGQDIFVISSPSDQGKQGVLHLIREQIQKQVVRNIKTKAITPHEQEQMLTVPVSEDEKYLITRKIVSAEKLRIPAQIIIYGDKVGITNFKDSLISIQVESKYIAETFKIMFDYIWQHS